MLAEMVLERTMTKDSKIIFHGLGKLAVFKSTSLWTIEKQTPRDLSSLLKLNAQMG